MRVMPFGSWPSPISSVLLAEDSIAVTHVNPEGRIVWWSEHRPRENRQVIVRVSPEAQPVDAIPEGFDVGTTAHTYGGASFVVHRNTLFVSNRSDQRLYAVTEEGEPRPITPPGEGSLEARYADFRVIPDGTRLVSVREIHGVPGDHEARNELVALPSDGSAEPWVIASGHDFYSSPRVSPDGRRIAWITWDHPNMPWDSSELWVAEVLDSEMRLGSLERIAGGPRESVLQPVWGSEGDLYYVSDRTGWWNIYRADAGGGQAIHPAESEFASPHWSFGASAYDALPDGRLVCTWSARGEGGLGVLDPRTGRLEQIDLGEWPIVDPPVGRRVRFGGDGVVLLAASPTRDWTLITLSLETGTVRVVRAPREESIDPVYTAAPEAIEFPTQGGRDAYGYFYRPTNPDAEGPRGERPPLMVVSHGGPTGCRTAALQPYIQFFTSRGFAVVDVNYGGSSGHGRAYRERIKGMWGIVDVEDCIAAARFLVQREEVDGSRLLIRGGSASGWTTLCAIASSDMFAAAADWYGVSDLESFVGETHKFESHYIYGLVAPPDHTDLYGERSPLRHADRIKTPLIVFQGTEDKAVPANQSLAIVEALRQNGVPVTYIEYQGEGHGFRKAENIRRSYDLELWFYGQALGFEPFDQVEPVEVSNRDALAHRLGA